jgi:hypothetical protein
MAQIKYIEIERFDAWLDYDISFVSEIGSMTDFIRLRRANLKTTFIYWIPCRLKIWHNEIYNPKTPILIFKN